MKKFQKILLLAGFVLPLGNLATAGTSARPDLTGQITEADGTPISKATVFVYTAGPKEGTSSLCPSCYADCQKQAQSDADGQFKIASLDPALLFRLLVLAGGHESKFVSKVNPTNAPQKITLKPLSEAALQSPLRIKGLVINAQGKPVPGAVISPEGVGLGSTTRWGGNDEVVEPLAIADEQGRFVLFCKTNTVDTVYAMVEGRGVAKQWATLKPHGDYLLRLPEGVTLTGRILQDGKPLKDVCVAATTKDRKCGVYFNCDPVATDSDGRFTLPNVPSGREFVVGATMASLHGTGALPNQTITTGESGTVQDLGRLSVQSAFTVAGRIVLSDGHAIPADVRLYLGRDGAADSQETKLDGDGRFQFNGVPAEPIALAVRINGYHFSQRNPSLDWLNGRILGRVSGDVTGLNLLLEPGKWQPNRDTDRPEGVDAYPADKPLRGVTL